MMRLANRDGTKAPSGPWASYQIRKIVGCACAGMPGTFSPPTLILNANCISGKRTELANIVDYTKPDAILKTDTPP